MPNGAAVNLARTLSRELNNTPCTTPPMSNNEAEIRACVDAFVAELSTIVRKNTLESVLEAITEAAGGTAAPKKRRGRPPGSKNKKPAAGKRIRRSSADVGQTTTSALNYIKANDGCSVSEMGAALGLTTKDLRLPLQKLLADKAVRTTGQKRGTRYHAGKAAAPRRAKKKRAAKKKTSRKKK